MKQKLKSEDYTNCLKATQLENKIKYFEKKKKNLTQIFLKKIIKIS